MPQQPLHAFYLNNIIMKKLIVVVSFLLIPFMLLCQDKKSGMSFGVNLGKWRGDADQFAKDLTNEINQEPGFSGFSFTNKPRVGFSMGFFIDYPIVNSFSIQPELNFIFKGTKLSSDGLVTIQDGYEQFTFEVTEDVIMQTNYLDLLVLAKYNLSKGKVKPYILAGPGVSYLVTSKMKIKVTVEDESETDSEKYEGFKNMDASINVGFGLELSKSLRIDARYQFGLVSIFQDQYSDGYNILNGGLAFNLVIAF